MGGSFGVSCMHEKDRVQYASQNYTPVFREKKHLPRYYRFTTVDLLPKVPSLNLYATPKQPFVSLSSKSLPLQV